MRWRSGHQRQVAEGSLFLDCPAKLLHWAKLGNWSAATHGACELANAAKSPNCFPFKGQCPTTLYRFSLFNPTSTATSNFLPPSWLPFTAPNIHLFSKTRRMPTGVVSKTMSPELVFSSILRASCRGCDISLGHLFQRVSTILLCSLKTRFISLGKFCLPVPTVYSWRVLYPQKLFIWRWFYLPHHLCVSTAKPRWSRHCIKKQLPLGQA